MKGLAVILLVLPFCLGRITKGPDSRNVGQVGQNLTLKCESNGNDGSVQWLNNKAQMVYVSSRGIKDAFKSMYDIITGNNRHYLVLKNPKLDQGGDYRCGDDDNGEIGKVLIVGMC